MATGERVMESMVKVMPSWVKVSPPPRVMEASSYRTSNRSFQVPSAKGTASPFSSSQSQRLSNSAVAVQSLMGTSALMVWISWTVLSVGSSSTNQLLPWVPPRMFRSAPPPRTSSMASSVPAGSRAVPSSRVMVKTMAAL